MGIFLKAEHHSWDLRTRYDWSSNEFELSYDGNLHIVVKYYDIVVDSVVKMQEDNLSEIMELIPSKPIDEKVVACDGSAWEFTVFDDTGKIRFQRELGYIYGIEDLEKIAGILESYIPEYEVPKYDMEISDFRGRIKGDIKIPDFLKKRDER